MTTARETFQCCIDRPYRNTGMCRSCYEQVSALWKPTRQRRESPVDASERGKRAWVTRRDNERRRKCGTLP